MNISKDIYWRELNFEQFSIIVNFWCVLKACTGERRIDSRLTLSGSLHV